MNTRQPIRMAQYYQLIGQNEPPIQAVTIEELRQYYPNITCVEATNGIQYVINQDEATTQFQSQQVLLAPEQQIVLNSSETTQQVVVNQSPMNFATGQTYIKQENEIVECQQPIELPHTSGQQPQQVFYTSGTNISQPVIEQSQPIMQQQQQQQQVLVNHIIQDQHQMVNHQIIGANQRVITQRVITEQVGHMMPQQINNAAVLQQRRVSVNVQSTSPRQSTPQVQYQQSTSEQNESENQLVQTSDGRVMTLGQLKEELSSSKKNLITPVKTNKTPPVKKPRAPAKPRTSNPRSRGNAANRGRGGANNRSPRMLKEPPQAPVNEHSPINPETPVNQQPLVNQPPPVNQQPVNQQTPVKQFPQLHNSPQKPVIQYGNKIVQPLQRFPQQSPQLTQQIRPQQPNQPIPPQQPNQQKPPQQQSNQQVIQTQNQLNNPQNQVPLPNQQLIQQVAQQRILQQHLQQNIRMPPQNAPVHQRLPQPNQPLQQQRMAQPQHVPLQRMPQQRMPQQQQQRIELPAQNQPRMVHPQQIQPQRLNQQPIIVQQRIPQQQQQFQQQRQQPIPLVPIFNGNIHKPGYSPPNQVQLIEDSCSSSVSDEYKDSAKMLVCLENGEQRLITFTLPKESCTVQDLLEQVGVPFDANTNIDCVTNTGIGEIDYIVSVGAVSSRPFVETQKVLTVDNLSESQECIVSQSGAVIPVSEPNPPASEPPKSPEKPPEPFKEVPRLQPGYLALCNHCGYLSEDFNRCQRCRTKMPDDPKAVPTAATLAKQEAELNKKIDTSKTKSNTLARLTPKQNAKTPGKPGRRSKKVAEVEPVILTLSSDEEDSPSKVTNTLSHQLVNRVLDNSIIQAVMEKEPKYAGGYPVIEEIEFNIKSETSDEKSVKLPCRTIRIGTHKFVPSEDVKISNLGLTISAPMPSDPTKCIPIFIPAKAILRVLVNFHKALPVLFYYLAPSAGVIIRNKLQMQQGSEIYYDPVSRQDPLKRLTLLPDIIDDELKTEILTIYSGIYDKYSLLAEIDTKEANEMLIRSCPKDIRADGLLTNATPILQNKLSNTDPKQLLIYPPPPAKGGITINLEDYLCLAQDQFLNDAIIDFYLKYLQIGCLDEQIQEKVHVFSSFFYKRLTTKPIKASKRLNPFEVDPNLTPSQKRHCRVKKWTKNVNIFDKDFVIIPINENSHWFLAIICYPGLDECRSFNDNSKVVKLPPKERRIKSVVEKHCQTEKTSTSVVIGNTTITLEKKSITRATALDKPIKCDDEELSDRDEAEGDESELDDSETDTESDESIIKISKKTREPIKQPCILIFDSLAGAGRSRVVATLRDYLTCEHRTKLNSTKTFTKDNIKGACPKVPQQMNFTDCGLYVLQYVESFFKRPVTDYHIPIKELKNWFTELEVTKKREDISILIKSLMCDLNRDTSFIPELTFPTLNGRLIGTNTCQETEEHGTDEEMETETIGTTQGSLVSESYNSEESDDNKRSEEQMNNSDISSSGSSCVMKMDTNNGTVVVTNINALYNADNDVQKKSNRETMSYLKSKRIIRHKNNDSFENIKKQKLE